MTAKTNNSKTDNNASLFVVNREAQSLMKEIVGRLSHLENLNTPSPLHPSFKNALNEVFCLIDHYQTTLLASSEYTVSCKQGCCDCCNHWVEDVNSFEAEIIAEYLRSTMPQRIDAIIAHCNDDCKELERLERLVSDRFCTISKTAHLPDEVDVLLGVFYQMRCPCPLLTENGRCSIYPIRPLTCRIYLSVSDPIRCSPEYINGDTVPTCIVDLSEKANEIVDRLHFRYLRFDGDTGLRSLLSRYLDRSTVRSG